MVDYRKIIISFSLPFLVAIIGSYFTYPEIEGWYSNLIKSEFNPPNWIFGPVWTILYFLMGVSFYLVFEKKNVFDNLNLYFFFFLQLFLNLLWSIFFFGLKNILLAFVTVIFLWISILLTILSFSKESKIASILLIPYLGWVSFAAILNYYILILN